MKVAILGCGPAGLFAAHAANRLGVEYRIFSRKVQSNIAGAQFLHVPIPGLEEDPDSVTIVRWGTAEAYAAKATGRLQRLGLDTSWTRWETQRAHIWSLASAYYNAWRGYENDIEDVILDWDVVDTLTRQYDLVVSTVPLKSIVKPDSKMILSLLSQEVYIVHAERVRGNVLVFNGLEERDWYRYSCLFGHSTLEFADRGAAEQMAERLGADRVIKAQKPYAIENPVPELMHPKVLKVGRHGRWHKLGLTHEAYYMTYETILKEVLPR